jgi:cytochrome P450
VLLSQKISGHTEVWRHELHHKYGDVVRTTPTEVSFATGRAWKEIYGYAPGSKYHRFSKDPKLYVVRRNYTAMLLADDSTHARQRKAFSNAFSDRALKQQEPLLRKHVDQLIIYLQNAATSGAAVNIVKPFSFVTFDIMGELALGESLGCLQGSDNLSWLNNIFASIKAGAYLVELQHFSWVGKLVRMAIPSSFLKPRRDHQRQISDRVNKRIACQERITRKLDIWQMVLDAKEDQKLSLDEMYANAGMVSVDLCHETQIACNRSGTKC